MKNNPITIIKNDHKVVEGLFKEYEGLGNSAEVSKRKVADQIIEELSVHAEMEEAICYPRFQEAFTNEQDEMIEEAYVEHSGVKSILSDLTTLQPDQPEFDANVKVLMEQVRHHVKEEEGEMLPAVEKEIPQEILATMGDEMVTFKEKMVGVQVSE